MAFGCASLGSALSWRQSCQLVEAAWAHGFRHFDTAPPYGAGQSERVLGEVLGALREQSILVTKVGIAHPRAGIALRALRHAAQPVSRLLPGLWSRAARRARQASSPSGRFDVRSVRASVAQSLRQLRTERLDALLLHEAGPDDLSDELGAQLDAWLRDGVVRVVGVGTADPQRARACLARWPGRLRWAQHAVDWSAGAADAACAADRHDGVRRVLHGALRSGLALLESPAARALCREPAFSALADGLGHRDLALAALVQAALANAGPGAGIVVSTRQARHLAAIGPDSAQMAGASALVAPMQQLLRQLSSGARTPPQLLDGPP